MSTPQSPTARLTARFEWIRGRTRMVECRSEAPLKIAKTFELADGVLEVCVMDSSPGLLDGDDYRFHWQLEAGAKVRITTQGFSRVHPAKNHALSERGAIQKTHISLASNAHLEIVPQPILLFCDANLKLELHADLAASATFFGGEIIGAGRVAHGESFAFASCHSRTQINREGEVIYITRNKTQPRLFAPQQLGAWGNFTHRANLWAFGPQANAELRDEWRRILNIEAQQFDDARGEKIESAQDLWCGVSTPERGGVIASLLGFGAWELQDAARQIFTLGKPSNI